MTFSEVDIYGDYLRKTFSESRHRWEKCLLLSIDIVTLYNPKLTLFSAAVSSIPVASFSSVTSYLSSAYFAVVALTTWIQISMAMTYIDTFSLLGLN